MLGCVAVFSPLQVLMDSQASTQQLVAVLVRVQADTQVAIVMELACGLFGVLYASLSLPPWPPVAASILLAAGGSAVSAAKLGDPYSLLGHYTYHFMIPFFVGAVTQRGLPCIPPCMPRLRAAHHDARRTVTSEM